MATWDAVGGAKGYLLDVSTSYSFSGYVDGYQGLDVGNVNGRAVTGLKPGSTYYYRVRPNTTASSGMYSTVTTATTEPATGLTIIPTFDCSIGGDPPAIEAMVMRAIAIYESLFSDPVPSTFFSAIPLVVRRQAPAPPPPPAPAAPLIRQALSLRSFRSLRDIVERFHQPFESGCNNEQRQQGDCQSAREPVIHEHRSIQCERPRGGID